MLIEIIIGVIFWALTVLVGRSFLTGTIQKRDKFIPIYLQSLTGISLLFLITYLMIFFEIDLKNFKYLLFPLVIISIINRKKLFKPLFKLNKINIIKATNIILMLMAFTWLNNSSLFESKMSMRYGPDQIGWIVSSEKLCSQKLNSIENYALNQTGATKINELFGEGINEQKIIYSVPNFNLQIANEFLVGAKRIGITSLAASICSSLEINNSTGILNTIIVIFILNLIIMIYRFTRKQNYIASSILCWYFLFNLGFISVHLEGGYGQTIGTVYILSIILSLREHGFKSKEFLIANVLTVIYSLTTYLDLIPIYALVLIPIAVYHFLKNQISYNEKKFIVGFLSIALATFALKAEIVKVFTNRLSNRNFGGWTQGRNPSTADMFGLNNWLPDDSITSVLDNYKTFTISTIFTICIFVILYLRVSKMVLLILSYAFIIYSIIYLDTYYISNDPINNYRLWKLSGYFLIVQIIVLTELINALKNKIKLGTRVTITFTLLFIFILGTHSSYQWIDAWQKNKSLSFSSRTKSEFYGNDLFRNHDIRVIGMGQPGLRLLLLDDINYYSYSRGFEVPVLRQFPDKPLVFIVDKRICDKSSKCILELESKTYAEKVFEFEEFNVFLEDLK